MKNCLTPLIALAATIFLLTPSIAQTSMADSIKITANYQNKQTATILGQLETDLGIKFYYKAEELPKKGFTGEFQKESLGEVVRQIVKRD